VISLVISLIMLPIRILIMLIVALGHLINGLSRASSSNRRRAPARRTAARSPVAGQSRSRQPSRPQSSNHLWWALSPAYSAGVIAFIPALHAAIKLQRRDVMAWAGALIAGDVVVWILASTTSASDGSASTPTALASIVLAIIGTVKAFQLRDAVFGEDDTQRQRAAFPNGAAQDPAVSQALAARQRRAESIALAREDPALARDLKIGRPDVQRQYNDGGLVDINHTSAEGLFTHLGFTREQARAVVEVRDTLSRFESVDDLISLVSLPPSAVDAVRDRILTL
jgi:DNA uptake protein ComE-like DNA-binding protein